MNGEAHVPHDAAAKACDLERRRVADGDVRLGIVLAQRPADHHLDDRELGRFLRQRGSGHLAIPQDDKSIRNLERLWETMRGEYDRDALRSQLAYQPEQIFCDVLGERGSRLVHKENLGVEGKRLGNFNQLLLPHAELGHDNVRSDPRANNAQHAFRALPEQDPVNGAEPPRWLSAQIDVLRHGAAWNQVQFLKDHRDAQALRLTHAANLDGHAAKEDASRVRARGARENAHQGRLARPVLADPRQDLS